MSHHIHVKINRRTAYLLGSYPYRKLIKHWSFVIPQWNYIRDKYAYWSDDEGKWKYRWDGRIKLLKRNSLPAGLFWATYRQIEKEEHVRFKIHTHHHLDIPVSSKRHWIVSEKSGATDYRYQNKCVDRILKKMYKTGGLILSATGSGKTRMAAQLASRLKCDILFIVDELVLLEQAKDDIAKHLGEKVGKVGESEFKPKRVTVATIQTLFKHRKSHRFQKWFLSLDVLIIDEIHVQMNRSNFAIVQAAKPKLVLGLTATLNLKQKPNRMKAFSLCGPVLYEFPLKQGQKLGVLSKGICIALKYNNSIREIEAYDSKEIYDSRIVNNAERNHFISRIVKRAYKLGYYVIVLVDRLKHLEEISERLHGIPRRVVAGSYKGEGIPKLDRIHSKHSFEKGKIKVIIASKVFKKGVSINRVDVIIDAAGRKSAEDAVQKFGRGIRLHKHKQGLIYFDISDYDKYDEDRDSRYRNKLAKAARKRIRALKAAGVPIFLLPADKGTKTLFKKGEKWLKSQK